MELTKDLKALIVDYVKKFLKNYIPPRYLNQKQACSYANVSPGTLNDWVKSKGLKVILLEENSNPKYDIKDIDEFMKKYKV
ncbi:DNA-binding protein [Jeotgalibaca porci]|uniref:DNA-binding protein n=1 Tax=Jeotgalibaca porci TaxID=1868793 RepID=UPI0035A029A1